jgi:DNA-binding MarR family transcriptional regulator
LISGYNMYIHIYMNSTVNRSNHTQLAQLPCACANLRRATRAVSQLYDDFLRPMGLRISQFTLLKVLESAGPVRQGILGGVLALDSTTLTRTLAPLKKEGWIIIRPGQDRRERMVEISAAGRRKLKLAECAWAEAQGKLRSALGNEAWQQLFNLTYHVTQMAQSA